MRNPFVKRTLLAWLAATCAASSALAGGHAWGIHELFSNPSGTVQFVEMRERYGSDGESSIGNYNLTSTLSQIQILVYPPPPTGLKYLLFGTAAFAALPGAPTPDRIIPDNFFSINGDTVSIPVHAMTFSAGQLPVDGILSLHVSGSTQPNSPTNFAGVTGFVNAAPGPPSVPDGEGVTDPLIGSKVTADGSTITVDWDAPSCPGSGQDFDLIFGEALDFPSTPGGAFGLAGAVCFLGDPPFDWNSTPTAFDGSGLIWWLVVVKGASGSEGSWGRDSNDLQRVGPGTGGSSGYCAVGGRDLSNTCGS